MSVKVALLHNIIAPYRFPLFEQLSKQKDIDLQVYFLSETAKNRKWDWKKYLNKMNFTYKVLPHWSVPLPLPEGIPLIFNPTYLWELIRGKYDVVVTAGWFDLSCIATYLFAPLLGYKYVIWSESTVHESSLQRTLTLPFVRWAVRNAAGCIAIGSASRDYLMSLGAAPEKIKIALSTVDVQYFQKKSKLSNSEKVSLRKKIAIPDHVKVILYVGQIIKRKGVITLIEAYEKLQRKNTALLFVGYGELKDELLRYTQERSIKNVFFVPHVEILDLPKYYAIADVFVLPSLEETWGLVVNEAMACGKAIILSDKVGCGRDLLEEGLNGLRFESGNSVALKECIERIVSDNDLLKHYGKHSAEIISKVTPDNAANAFSLAIQEGNR